MPLNKEAKLNLEATIVYKGMLLVTWNLITVCKQIIIIE